jgi:hypothetical protein
MLLDNFQDPLKVFLALASDFMKKLDGEWMGSGEKDKRRIGYGESGERWVERAEAEVFAKRERFKKLVIHATSPKSLAQVIHAFRKLSGHTP